MVKKLQIFFSLFLSLLFMLISANASAGCADITRAQFRAAVDTAVTETSGFGFGLPMWVTMVNEAGRICYVYSSDGTTANKGRFAGNTAWLGSRLISAQKAFTANAFSLDGLAISAGFISATIYPQGSLYGLQHSNPVDASQAYGGSPAAYGTRSDPLVGKIIGGINVFGGGVALYNGSGVKIGAIGASGDTSCRDHTVAYRTRIALSMNNQPSDDGLVLIDPPAALGDHPTCGVSDPTTNAWDDSASDFGVRP